MTRLRTISILSLSLLFLAGCEQGRIKEKPPIHPNPNMDTQPKYKPFRESNFFVDGSDMRLPIDGTVAQGELRADSAWYIGKTGPDSYMKNAPVTVDNGLLLRGRERYNIYCSPCHGPAGDGRGAITRYKYPIPPTSLHEERIVQSEDGYIFAVITNGIRNMPRYDHQIPVPDRWAIVAHIRQLEKQGAPPTMENQD